jgi:predicted dithiol-disulfide oxidoreductase (DUF899 family)
MTENEVVSREEWLTAHKELLKREKELTRLGDQLSVERRKLPWIKVEKNYVFDGPKGKETLADLFEGRSQLIVYHFMSKAVVDSFPGWEDGCPTCSIVADHINAGFVHLANRDVTLLAISRLPIQKIEAFKKRMGWSFNWVSSHENDFNHDYGVLAAPEEIANGKVTTTTGFNNGMSTRPRINTASVCSTKIAPITSSILILVTDAGARSCSASTSILTVYRRAATKTRCPFRWHGCATTIATRPLAALRKTKDERAGLLPNR